MEKVGFRNEGIAQRFLEINGVWEDHHRFAITVEEWMVRNDELSREWLAAQ
jgi:ribosomal-protein-alanine N-acetyltransferase